MINHKATASRHQNYTTHRRENEKLVLGIETSCDDTGIAIVSDQGRILAEGLSSHCAQMQEAGGVVPHLARREHQSNLGPLLDQVMRESGLIKPIEGTPDYSKLSAIAVTAGPGNLKPNISIYGPSQQVIIHMALPRACYLPFCGPGEGQRTGHQQLIAVHSC